jgi:hypothetical protein
MQKQIDSLNNLIAKAQEQGIYILTPKKDTTTKPKKDEDVEEGTELVLRNLTDGKEQRIKLVQEYLFSKYGNRFLVETTKKNNSNIKPYILYVHLKDGKPFNKPDTLLNSYYDVKQFTFSETGEPAFLATFDTTKNEQKEFKIYCFTEVERNPTLVFIHPKGRIWNYDSHSYFLKGNLNMDTSFRINENFPIYFSKSGDNLFFGVGKRLPIKDTTLPEFERVNVDVWNYKDDDVMTAQLKNVDAETKKSYLAKYPLFDNNVIQLGQENFEPILVTQEGDGKYFYAVSDSGKRVEAQWQGYTKKDVFIINPETGASKQIMSDIHGGFYPSYTGKYLLVYDEEKKQYSCFNADSNKTKPVARDIPYPLYDEENDVPDAPNAYGIAKWMKNDKYVLIYDRYDIWKVDPIGKEKSVCITNGRKNKVQYRYVTVDNDEKFISDTSRLFLRAFNEIKMLG